MKPTNLIEQWQSGVSMFSLISQAQKIFKDIDEQSESQLAYLACMYHPESPLLDIADLSERKESAFQISKMSVKHFETLSTLTIPKTRKIIFAFLDITPKREDMKLLMMYEELIEQNYEIIYATSETQDLKKEAVEIQQKKAVIAELIFEYSQKIKQIRKALAGDDEELLDALKETNNNTLKSYIERNAK